MNNGSSYPISGAVSFWATGEWSDRNKIREGLYGLNLDAFLPKPRESAACLRCALQEVVGGPRTLVRPLKKTTGFVVVGEERGEESNTYQDLFTAKIDDDTGFVNFTDHDYSRQDKILAEFNRQREYLVTSQVGDMLVRISQSLGGTRLKPTGGVYWLPESALGTWSAVAGLVEGASVKGASKVYLIRHHFDSDAIRAVQDAIIAEVSAEVTQIDAEIQEGLLGGRGLEFRKEKAMALREKVKQYEAILGVGLASLTQSVETVELAAAQAALALSSAQGTAVFV